MAISDKLTYLADTKDAIRDAIIAQGVAVGESDTFRSYAARVADIEGGGGTGPVLREATFWRLQLLASYNSTDTNTYRATIANIELREVLGGVNVATGGTATATSQYSSAMSASEAFNGDAETAWIPAPGEDFPMFIQYELTSPAEIVQISMQAGDTEARASRMPTVFRILNSTDGITWEYYSRVDSVSEWEAFEIRVFDIEP